MYNKNIFVVIMALSISVCLHTMHYNNLNTIPHKQLMSLEMCLRYKELMEQQKNKTDTCQLTAGRSVCHFCINNDDTIAFIKEFAELYLRSQYGIIVKPSETLQLLFEGGKTFPDETSWQEMKKMGITQKIIALHIFSKTTINACLTNEQDQL
jgi:hypothetical protein